MGYAARLNQDADVGFVSFGFVSFHNIISPKCSPRLLGVWILRRLSIQIDCVSRKMSAWGSIIFTEDKLRLVVCRPTRTLQKEL